jgi:hypothetical protein
VLVAEVGARADGTAAAERCWSEVVRLTGLLRRSRRPLPVVKDAAYAWRQLVFFCSLPGQDAVAVAAGLAAGLTDLPAHVRDPLAPVVGGLADIAAGGTFDADGRSAHGRRFTGWAVGPHWLLAGTGRMPSVDRGGTT